MTTMKDSFFRRMYKIRKQNLVKRIQLPNERGKTKSAKLVRGPFNAHKKQA